jgi:hypothetical protein
MAEPLRLLSFVADERGYCALLAGPDGAEALLTDGEATAEASASGAVEQGRAVLGDGDEQVELGWSPAGPMLEFGMGEESVRAYAIAGSASRPAGSSNGPGVAWELPSAGFAAIRTIWAVTEKGDLLLLVAVRPEGAASHEEEVIGAARILPGAEPYGYVEPLLSTEYDAAGLHTRATLELWAGAEEHVPERGGGLRVVGGTLDAPIGRLAAARFSWRLDGKAAIGAYEILTP